MKRNAIARIVLFSLIALILTGILVTGLLFRQFAFNSDFPDIFHNSGTVSSTGSVSAADIANISIEWPSGTIRIQPGDVDRITFAETETGKERQQMVWSQDGNTLNLHFSEESFSFLSFGFSTTISKDLLITVPRNWQCEELSISVASADVTVEDMTINEVDFDGASGVCVFENSIVNELSVDTASGNIHFTGTLDVLDCDAASADCVIQVTNVPSRIDLDSASGDLELILPEYAGFSVSLDALSGDFTSDFPTTVSGGCYVYGNGSCRIDVDAMSGEVNIRKAVTEPNPTIPGNTF